MRKSVRIAARAENDGGMERGRRRDQEAVKYLTKEEVERFFRCIPAHRTRDLLLFDIIYRYGLRRSEAGLLALDDIRGGKIWIARRKHGVSAAYPLHPRTATLLRAYLRERRSDSARLFPSRRRGHVSLSGGEINRLFHRYATAAALPPRSVHSLRHSIGVHLANAGYDLADVQDWLGHRDISSTLVYFRVTDKRREAKYRAVLKSGEIARTDGQP